MNDRSDELFANNSQQKRPATKQYILPDLLFSTVTNRMTLES